MPGRKGQCERKQNSSQGQSKLMRAIAARPSDYVAVRKSGVHGKGVFAVVDLPASRLLGYYKGKCVSLEDYARRATDNGYILDMETYVLDAGKASNGNWTRYVNDARGTRHRNNCEFSVGGAIKTTRAIVAGAELFVSYGRDYWMGR